MNEREALDRIAEIVGWEPGTDPEIVVAYVAKRDGSRAMAQATVDRRTEMLRAAVRGGSEETWPRLLSRVYDLANAASSSVPLVFGWRLVRW